LSRPLPQIPRPLTCRQCKATVTSYNALLPSSAIPSESEPRKLRGFLGEACLFTETYNVILSRPRVELMATGAHTMQEITCSCTAYLGYKILRAFDSSEQWKVGTFLLELAELEGTPRLASFPESDEESA
ncbi:hypothetical protein C8J57DRAFT_1049043, partial [Mycena rebaudengoi]